MSENDRQEKDAVARNLKTASLVILAALAIGVPVVVYLVSAFSGHTFTFANESTVRVSVDPNGQDWKGFLLNPGDVRKITIADDHAYFVFLPGEGVGASVLDARITFRDRPGPGQVTSP